MQTNYIYFRFKEGRYFRTDEGYHSFEMLNNNYLWESSYDIERLFYDAASDYFEITDLETIKKLESFKEKETLDFKETK